MRYLYFLVRRRTILRTSVRGGTRCSASNRHRPPAVCGSQAHPSHRVARARGITTIIDNTWATPLCFKPIEHGVDLVVHALTKYQSGNSDILLGAIVARDEAHHLAVDHRPGAGRGITSAHEAVDLPPGLAPIDFGVFGEAAALIGRKAFVLLDARGLPGLDEIDRSIGKATYAGDQTFLNGNSIRDAGMKGNWSKWYQLSN